MPVPPPLELKLMIKRSQYRNAKSERKRELIAQKVKVMKRRAANHAPQY